MCIRDRASVFAVVAFAFNEAAYASETIRAAILSVSEGEIEAARSLGMTNAQVYRRVIIPNAAVVATPTPVSYTHLDVYKRQISSHLQSYLETRMDIFQEKVKGKFVSATLDVYKRQQQLFISLTC